MCEGCDIDVGIADREHDGEPFVAIRQGAALWLLTIEQAQHLRDAVDNAIDEILADMKEESELN